MAGLDPHGWGWEVSRGAAFWWLAAWLTFIVSLVFVLLPLAVLAGVGEVAVKRLRWFVLRDWWFFDRMGVDP